jgi:ABC-2 type transport system permease protein
MTAAARAPADNAASAWRCALAQAGMELRMTARRGENVLVTIVVPAVVLVFFTAFPVVDTGSGNAVGFVLPGVLALAVISTSLVNLGIATAYERSYGVLKRLGGTPLPRSGLIAAKIAAVAVIELIQLVLLLAIAAGLLGWRPSAATDLPILVVALVAGTAAFAGLGLLMAGTLRAEATLAGANGLFVLFLLVGGVVVPVDRLPTVLADLARILPADVLSEALRIALGASEAAATGPLLILIGWAIVTVAAAIARFRWE